MKGFEFEEAVKKVKQNADELKAFESIEVNLNQDEVIESKKEDTVIKSRDMAIEKQEVVIDKAPLEEKPAEFKRVDKFQVVIVVLLVVNMAVTIYF